jgi:hypothetical protein
VRMLEYLRDNYLEWKHYEAVLPATKWKKIGAEIWARTLYFVNSHLDRQYIQCVGDFRNNCSLTPDPSRWPQWLRSLSVHYDGITYISGELPYVLRQLPVLHTFSLRVHNSLVCDNLSRKPRFLPNDTILVDIVKSLQPSVKQLHINTAGIQIAGGRDPDRHICFALSSLLVQLHHVSLNLKCICPLLFHSLRSLPCQTQRTSSLRTLRIKLQALKDTGNVHVERSMTSICFLHHGPPDHTPSAISSTRKFLYSSAFIPLAQSLRRLISVGAFPDTEYLKICDGGYPGLKTQQREWPAYRVYDALKDTTTMFPLLFKHITCTSSPSRFGILRLPGDVDVVGLYSIIRSIPTEGIEWFRSPINEMIHPASFKPSRFVRHLASDEIYDGFMDTSGNPSKYLKLRQREKDAGKRLLHATVTQGIQEVCLMLEET